MKNKENEMTDAEIQDTIIFDFCAENICQQLASEGKIWKDTKGHWESIDKDGHRMSDTVYELLILPLALAQARCELDSMS